MHVKYFATALVHGAEPPHRGRPPAPSMHLCIDASGSTVRGRLPSGHGGARAHERRSEPGAARAAVPARALAAAAERARSIGSRASRRSTPRRPTSGCGAGSRASSWPTSPRRSNERKVVQGTLLRSTIHLVSAGDYWPFAIGTRAARQEAWLRFDKKRLSRSDLTSAAKEVRKTLSGRVLHRDELLDLARKRDPERPTHLWNGLAAWIELVRAPPSGTWERRRADLYALADEWLEPPTVTPEESVEILLRRYLTGFGPARLADAANWAGLAPTAVQEAAEGLRLRRFRDEEDRELVDLPRAPLPGGPDEGAGRASCRPGTQRCSSTRAARRSCRSASARSSSTRRRRTRSPTFLVDGAVAGKWSVEATKKKATLVLEPFERLPAAAKRELREEGERLVRFVEPDAELTRVPDAARSRSSSLRSHDSESVARRHAPSPSCLPLWIDRSRRSAARGQGVRASSRKTREYLPAVSDASSAGSTSSTHGQVEVVDGLGEFYVLDRRRPEHRRASTCTPVPLTGPTRVTADAVRQSCNARGRSGILGEMGVNMTPGPDPGRCPRARTRRCSDRDFDSIRATAFVSKRARGGEVVDGLNRDDLAFCSRRPASAGHAAVALDLADTQASATPAGLGLDSIDAASRRTGFRWSSSARVPVEASDGSASASLSPVVVLARASGSVSGRPRPGRHRCARYRAPDVPAAAGPSASSLGQTCCLSPLRSAAACRRHPQVERR